MGFYSFLVSRIKNIRYSVSGGQSTRTYVFGALYSGPYQNYAHDPQPLVFIMYSAPSPQLTHALNIHYLAEGDRAWMIRNIYMIKKYQQVIDPRTLYNFIKIQRPSIIKTCYRTYHTNLCQYKLVSAGITNLTEMEYPSNEPFVRRLNEAIGATQMAQNPQQVAFSTTELNERIAESLNSQPIQTRTVAVATGPFGRGGVY